MTYRKFMNHETKAVVSIHEPHPEPVLKSLSATGNTDTSQGAGPDMEDLMEYQG